MLNLSHAVCFVIPGRAEGAGPESTLVAPVLWIPGSRLSAAARDDRKRKQDGRNARRFCRLFVVRHYFIGQSLTCTLRPFSTAVATVLSVYLSPDLTASCM